MKFKFRKAYFIFLLYFLTTTVWLYSCGIYIYLAYFAEVKDM